jgi:hypothetical protein
MKNRNQKTVCEKKGTFRTLKVKELERVIGGCPEVIVKLAPIHTDCPQIILQ